MRADWNVSRIAGSIWKLSHALAVVAVLGLTLRDVRADDQQFTEQQILDALTVKHLTRCPHRESSGCGQLSKDKGPKIDFEVLFGYGSARLNVSAKSSILTAFGAYLARPNAKHSYLLLAGHTDANGGDRFNQTLSERRAETVKRYLVEQFKLAPEQLRAIGFGKTELKNAADSFAGENRRVQIVNAEFK